MELLSEVTVLLVVIVVARVQGDRLGSTSVQHRSQDDHGNYVFSYNIADPWGSSNGRWEIGDAFGNKRGGYTITEADGRKRYVEYIADKHGFRVVVRTNEPGTAGSATGTAVIASPYSDEGSAHSHRFAPASLTASSRRRRPLTQHEIDYAPLIATESAAPVLAAYEPLHIQSAVVKTPIELPKVAGAPRVAAPPPIVTTHPAIEAVHHPPIVTSSRGYGVLHAAASKRTSCSHVVAPLLSRDYGLRRRRYRKAQGSAILERNIHNYY
ncbi:uncharacterized protein LOC111252452 isoform X2 [Varroa destructor]|uniref:Uncharacterized protein n=1 Tax=Varroa destructor TaxID=109461 RepID=A0A7M7KHK7_VARDE|nr:uncharacterized protein LOC111252452 isoform X2 [Varroa destructor]